MVCQVGLDALIITMRYGCRSFATLAAASTSYHPVSLLSQSRALTWYVKSVNEHY